MYSAAIAIFGSILLILRLPAAWQALGACLVLPMLLYSPPRPAFGEFAMLALDIGQGNAVLMQTAHHSLLYDTGPRFSRESDAGQRTLVPLLRALGEKLDVVMVSHSDSDHSGGANAVLAMQSQARLLTSMKDDREVALPRQPEPCMAGQRWDWDGVHFEVLHPKADDYASELKPNAMSCVLRISNGRQAVLLAGDLEAAQELRLVQDQANLKADVLLVPHHGSKTSSTPAFLEAVQPSLAIVQAGYRNRFGHPAAQVMERYSARNIRVLASPACGAVLWRSDGAEAVACQRELARRYWHH